MTNSIGKPIKRRKGSRDDSSGRLVGSLGREGMQLPVSKGNRELARSMVFSDHLDIHKPSATEQDSLLLEEGVLAPSEHDRISRERRDLLNISSVPEHESLPSQLPNERIASTLNESRRLSLGQANEARSISSGYGAVDEDESWDEALLEGDINTSSFLEFKTLTRNAIPLSITFFLQYSLFMSSLLCVGHLGKVELGAVSLGAMTSNITGAAFVQGMATCLDTLCSQAYGAGRPELVGLYFQKGVLMIMMGLVPILALWYRADIFLRYIVSNDEESEELIILAAKYLRVMILAMPGFTLFECGKRYMQSQGIFHASTLILVICAPLNVLITLTLVWNKHIGIGFLGAPLSVSIIDTLMAVLLIGYIAFVDGKECWGGFTWRAFHNWKSLIRLAIPGFVMVESEFLAYEVMTLAASYLGTDILAVQTILSSVTALLYEIPFAVGCAVATRLATFIGANLIDAAKRVTKVAISLAAIIGILNGLLMIVFRRSITALFTKDPDVANMAIYYLPLCSIMHFLDCIACVLAGILRGQGRQQIGGYINLGCYHLLGVPLGVFLCFGHWHLGLAGIWLGFYVALGSVTFFSLIALRMSHWKEYSLVSNSSRV